MRALADECGALLMADEVICGFGRLGAWLGVERGYLPDIVTVAKGLTSAYAPMGAVILTDAVAEPLLESKRPAARRHLRGASVSAAIALKSIEIFERDGVLENVGGLEGHLAERMESLRELPIVGDVRGRGFFWAVEMVSDSEGSPFDADARELLLRGFLRRRLLEADNRPGRRPGRQCAPDRSAADLRRCAPRRDRRCAG